MSIMELEPVKPVVLVTAAWACKWPFSLPAVSFVSARCGIIHAMRWLQPWRVSRQRTS